MIDKDLTERYNARLDELIKLREQWRQQQLKQQNPTCKKTSDLTKHLLENVKKINEFLISFNTNFDKLAQTDNENKSVNCPTPKLAIDFSQLTKQLFELLNKLGNSKGKYNSAADITETLSNLKRELLRSKIALGKSSDFKQSIVELHRTLDFDKSGENSPSFEGDMQYSLATIASEDVAASSPF